MANIALSACNIYKSVDGDFTVTMIKTPATADSADDIDVSTLATDTNVLSVFAWDVTGADSVTCTLDPATNIITLDAGGATTDHTYCVEIKYIAKPFTP